MATLPEYEMLVGARGQAVFVGNATGENPQANKLTQIAAEGQLPFCFGYQVSLKWCG